MSDVSGNISPEKIIFLKLKRNKLAIGGFFWVLLMVFISLFAYVLAPDKTKNANNGIIQLKLLPPLSTINYIKLQLRDSESGFLEKYSIGGDVFEKHIPITKIEVQPSSIVYTTLNGQKAKAEQSMLVKKNDFNDEASYTYSKTYFFGTDKAGRDILSRLLIGTRVSLIIGLFSVLISVLIGFLFGSLAGYFGGWVDQIINWFMSVVWSIPGIMLVMMISLVLSSKGLWVVFIAIGFTSWVDVARIVRGQILSLKEKQYIEAAKILGISNFRIIIKHIFPNLLGPIIVVATANFAYAILTEAGLSFLGLGVQPPVPSWGGMVNEGFKSIGLSDGFHLIVFPSLSICFLVLAFNLLGNGIRDAYDPRSK